MIVISYRVKCTQFKCIGRVQLAAEKYQNERRAELVADKQINCILC